jgi:hypothetical protein
MFRHWLALAPHTREEQANHRRLDQRFAGEARFARNPYSNADCGTATHMLVPLPTCGIE